LSMKVPDPMTQPRTDEPLMREPSPSRLSWIVDSVICAAVKEMRSWGVGRGLLGFQGVGAVGGGATRSSALQAGMRVCAVRACSMHRRTLARVWVGGMVQEGAGAAECRSPPVGR
jgi:hypothetical protein